MKNEKKTFALPPFVHNQHLRTIAIFITLNLVLGLVIAFLYNLWVGVVLLVLACVGLFFIIKELNVVEQNADNYMDRLSYLINRGEQESLLEMPLGVLILDSSQRVSWINPYLQPYFQTERVVGRTISQVAPQLAELIKKNWDQDQSFEAAWNGHYFNFLIQRQYRTIYMMDITHYADLEVQYENEKIAIGEIYLDNFDEVSQSMSDQEISNLRNYVTNKLTDWAQEYGIYLKRIDAEHYSIMMYVQSLRDVEKDKFNVLDTIRKGTVQQNFPITLSIGIAYGDTDLNRLADLAQSNLDLALGRGGDQAVIKAKDGKAIFFGGKTNPMEKRTRVRARMITHALVQLMGTADKIFVDGHQQPDMDSWGAAMGIRRIAQMNGKECYIVFNNQDVHTDIRRLLDKIEDYPDIQNSIITSDEAVKLATDDSLMIMVDHSNPKIGVAQDLYQKLENRVVIIDHHRRGEEFPANPLLAYVEPYASSACELITEMFEYQSQSADPMNDLEATAMLTGIVVDTQSFTVKTGTRTFDAASYLRSAGANVDEISSFMKENVKNYMAENHLISLVKFETDHVAIITAEDDVQYDSVTAAKSVDSLLSVDGVEASFVVFRRYDGNVGISARSDGSINVQVIMEKLGGGGHLGAGATQIKDQSVPEASELLQTTIQDSLVEDEAAAE
ncbi:DHH family phosphoesterase [Fructilactobacillus carniphilus]|uniref:Cyclic-di-AMP phosphodiesterase n=1 Tax=Fructilactobacillus carniphilus TaxID=2940297 RepID=A0ABY5BVR7_9LACO|nr:DHH family phosphoesterase [Fructilactobacillus carniphilus]USS90432.1 DHH family phosphoesterase [Fructilactobacillus carniphilus]